MGCESCGTVHHQDCWTYNKGCARYACSAGPRWRSLPEQTEVVAPDGKILLSHLSFGSYDGIYYAPWLASLMTIVFELVGLLGPAFGFSFLFGYGLSAMCLCILWIAVSSERYYLDLENRAITRSKALFGHDVLEWKVWSLARVGRLALVPAPGMEERFLLAAVDRNDDGILPLAPSMQSSGPAFSAARDLLVKLKANNVFPVEIPHAARIGASEKVLRIIDARTLDEGGDDDEEDGIQVLSSSEHGRPTRG